MEETWSNYKTKPATASLYTEDAAVIYVPTGAGARGSAQIRRFYLQPGFSQKANTLNEQVHSKVIAGNRIIEEAEWNITFHGGECTWLAPNVDEGLLMNATIKLPVVISATFEGSQIALLRVYWDQATVLKQLRVISDRQKWPVLGSVQVEALKMPQTMPLNPFQTDAADLAPPVKKAPGQKTLAIDAPGRVFGPVRPEDEVSRPVRRNLQAPSRNIFAYEPTPERPSKAHDPHRLDASFSFAHDESSPSPKTPTPASPPQSQPKTTRTERNIFASYGEDPVDDLTHKTASLNTSTKRQQPQQQQTRNILFHE